MSEYLLLTTLFVMVIAICVDFYRVFQFKNYIEQNKIILQQMTLKIKQLRDVSIKLEHIQEMQEAIDEKINPN